MAKQKITYESSGVKYAKLDEVKKSAQTAAAQTGRNLTSHGFSEIDDSRGESAYVWKQGNVFMATVIEGLGTKNLVADAMGRREKTYYDVIGHDSVATIINDLVTVGATPLVVHAYWAVEDNSWLENEKRLHDLIEGWKDACNLSGAAWGGGETPTLKGILKPNTIELGGSAVGMIAQQAHLLSDTRLEEGDHILFLHSNGINANGLTLARKVAESLSAGYRTKMDDGGYYGDGLLTKTNIYATLVRHLLEKNINLHYITNITGHGLRKIMRAKPAFSYVIDTIFEPQPVFTFIQQKAHLTDEEMYATFNMGQDYALFLPGNDVKDALALINQQGFKAIDAGIVQKGTKQVVIKPKNITFKAETLDLR